jgi:type I restriction enzyme M protein
VSKLIAQLAMHKPNKREQNLRPSMLVLARYCCKPKSNLMPILLKMAFLGQEINHTTYNLARMNMFLHNINYDKFNIQLGDTLTQPAFWR